MVSHMLQGLAWKIFLISSDRSILIKSDSQRCHLRRLVSRKRNRQNYHHGLEVKKCALIVGLLGF